MAPSIGECGRAIFRQRQRLFIANLSCHRRIRANQPRSIASISWRWMSMCRLQDNSSIRCLNMRRVTMLRRWQENVQKPSVETRAVW
ncbi:Uncharacterised protein [Segatella copri]|nr:Uncharacterised protein [Segatella copri]